MKPQRGISPERNGELRVVPDNLLVSAPNWGALEGAYQRGADVRGSPAWYKGKDCMIFTDNFGAWAITDGGEESAKASEACIAAGDGNLHVHHGTVPSKMAYWMEFNSRDSSWVYSKDIAVACGDAAKPGPAVPSVLAPVPSRFSPVAPVNDPQGHAPSQAIQPPPLPSGGAESSYSQTQVPQSHVQQSLAQPQSPHASNATHTNADPSSMHLPQASQQPPQSRAAPSYTQQPSPASTYLPAHVPPTSHASYDSAMHPMQGQQGHSVAQQASGFSTHGVAQQTSARTMQGEAQQTSARPMQGVEQQTSMYSAHGVAQQTSGFPTRGVEQQTSGFPTHGVEQQTSGFPTRGVEQQTSGFPTHGVEQQTSGFPTRGVEQQTSGFPTRGVEQQTSMYSTHGAAQQTSTHTVMQGVSQQTSMVPMTREQQTSTHPMHGVAQQTSAVPMQGYPSQGSTLPHSDVNPRLHPTPAQPSLHAPSGQDKDMEIMELRRKVEFLEEKDRHQQRRIADLSTKSEPVVHSSFSSDAPRRRQKSSPPPPLQPTAKVKSPAPSGSAKQPESPTAHMRKSSSKKSDKSTSDHVYFRVIRPDTLKAANVKMLMGSKLKNIFAAKAMSGCDRDVGPDEKLVILHGEEELSQERTPASYRLSGDSRNPARLEVIIEKRNTPTPTPPPPPPPPAQSSGLRGSGRSPIRTRSPDHTRGRSTTSPSVRRGRGASTRNASPDQLVHSSVYYDLSASTRPGTRPPPVGPEQYWDATDTPTPRTVFVSPRTLSTKPQPEHGRDQRPVERGRTGSRPRGERGDGTAGRSRSRNHRSGEADRVSSPPSGALVKRTPSAGMRKTSVPPQR